MLHIYSFKELEKNIKAGTLKKSEILLSLTFDGKLDNYETFKITFSYFRVAAKAFVYACTIAPKDKPRARPKYYSSFTEQNFGDLLEKAKKEMISKFHFKEKNVSITPIQLELDLKTPSNQLKLPLKDINVTDWDAIKEEVLEKSPYVLTRNFSSSAKIRISQDVLVKYLNCLYSLSRNESLQNCKEVTDEKIQKYKTIIGEKYFIEDQREFTGKEVKDITMKMYQGS